MTTLEVAPRPAEGRPRPAPDRRPVWASWSAPAVAAAVALIGSAVGWRGVDLPAQLYRVAMFHRVGFSLWDPQWYGGHWAIDYSVLFPPVAATVGVAATAAASAGFAALAFDRLVIGHFGRRAWVGSLLFAVGTMEQLAIGQFAFLLGEALALTALWAGSRRRWVPAAMLALASSLASPLAGAFLAMAALAWVIGARPRDRSGAIAILVGAAAPIAAVAVMFPGQGSFPFPFGDAAFELPAAVVMWLVAHRSGRVLRIGAALYAVATAASFVVRTPVGGNVGRLGECVAIPLGACVLWPHRKLMLTVLAVPMALWQWTPAWGAISNRDAGQPSVSRGYYTPLLAFLAAHPLPAARVEVVPTKFHWEADFVGPTVPLARGWERQLDTADDPLFYGGDRLDASGYHAWLLAAGVRYVALPDAPLDFAATAEARLIAAGVPGLRPVWRDTHWQVYVVDGSSGIVSGPARLVRMDGDHVELAVSGPGTVVVRVRSNGHWSVTRGKACLSSLAGWTVLETPGAGVIELTVGLAPRAPHFCAAPIGG